MRPLRPTRPPQLVQLRESHAVGLMDDDRVDIGDVQPGLYDRCGHQHIDRTRDEIIHDPLQLRFLHLAVRTCNLRLGHKMCQARRLLLDVIDPVVHVIDLPLAGEFPQDRLPDHFLVVFHDIGLDRDSAARRLLQDTHIPDAHKAHVERARDRRRRERQDIHVLLHLLDLFLVRDPEALLLVHDQKAEILELDILGEQAVRPDHDIADALADVAQRLFLVRRRPEPG